MTNKRFEMYKYLNAYRKPKDNQPICKANKYALLMNVKTFMGKMHNRGVIENNPVAHIELPSVGRPLPKAIFTAEEVEKILEQPLLFGEKGLVDRVILETFFATGIRRVDLRDLDVEDIDIKQQLVRIRKGKGDREYILPISERACEWIVFYLAKLRPQLATISPGSALFLNDKGARFRVNALSDAASRFVRLAGFKRGGACHLFRHSTATIMLGHANITSTQIYTFVSRSKLTEVYNKTHPSALSDKRFFQ